MTFQFACRKPPSGKDLEPASPDSCIQYRVYSIVNPESRIQYRVSRIESPTLAHFRHFSSLFTNFPSTSVEDPLQINPFYAKQSQFPRSQMNVNPYNTTDYERKCNWTLGEKNPIKPNLSQLKPISKPIKPNLQKAKMNIS